MATREEPRAVSHGMARGELFLRWEDAVREGRLSVPNPTSALKGALAIRCDFARLLLVDDRRMYVPNVLYEGVAPSQPQVVVGALVSASHESHTFISNQRMCV